MNCIKSVFSASCALVAGAAIAAVAPTVTGVSMSQDAGRKVTVSYTLSDADAVVTFAVETNGAGAWARADASAES